MSKKQIIKSGAFICIFAVLFFLCVNVLKAKWLTGTSETYVFEDFYDLAEDSIDVCFIGNSQIVYGINGMDMYEDYGISAYSLASGNQPVLTSYYWLKEALKTQDFPLLIIDVSMLYENAGEHRFRMNIDTMKWSSNKVEAILEHSKSETADPAISYFFKIMKYHSRWQELTEEDFDYSDFRNFVYRGNNMEATLLDNKLSYEELMIDNDEPEEVEIVEEHREYMIKMIELCKEKGIDVLLVKTPKDSWSLTRHEGAQEIADTYGLEFLDFNFDEMLQAFGFNIERDMKDIDHLNIRGADKLSAYLSEYILDHYQVTDYRTAEKFDIEEFEQYQKDHKDKYLQSSYDVEELLSYLKDSRYDIVIQSSSDISALWLDEYNTYLEDLGVTTKIQETSGYNYTITIHGGESVYEQVYGQISDMKKKQTEEMLAELLGDQVVDEEDEELLAQLEEVKYFYEGTFSDETSFRLLEEVDGRDTYIIVKVNGVEQTFKKNGLNMYIYDNELGCMVDKVTIAVSGDKLKIYHDFN